MANQLSSNLFFPDPVLDGPVDWITLGIITKYSCSFPVKTPEAKMCCVVRLQIKWVADQLPLLLLDYLEVLARLCHNLGVISSSGFSEWAESGK